MKKYELISDIMFYLETRRKTLELKAWTRKEVCMHVLNYGRWTIDELMTFREQLKKETWEE